MTVDYGVANRKTLLTPMVVQTDRKKSFGPSQATIAFRQLVGSLLGLLGTQTPIGDATCRALGTILHVLCSRSFSCISACSNMVKYRKLVFRGGLRLGAPSSSACLSIYSYSDWALGSTDRKSYFGNAQYFNGDIVAWFTQKQPVVATSSTEAE